MLDPLESRNLSTGIARRTLKNLDFIKQAYLKGKDVHAVVQTVNSLLGLLMFPIEKEIEFFRALEPVTLNPPDYFLNVRQALPEFPLLPSLEILQLQKCTNLSRFFKRLRNAIAHRNLSFSNDSRDLATEIITLKDRKNEYAPFDWEIRISAEDMERLSRYVSQRVIDENL